MPGTRETCSCLTRGTVLVQTIIVSIVGLLAYTHLHHALLSKNCNQCDCFGESLCKPATCSNHCFKSTVIVISESCSPMGGQYVKSLAFFSEFPGTFEQMFSTRIPQKVAKKERSVCSGQPTSYLKGPKPLLEIHRSPVLKSIEILQKHSASSSMAASNSCQGQRSTSSEVLCAFAAHVESTLSGCRCSL